MSRFSEGFGGKTAFITGGASGIGRAAAARLVREGATVVIADRDAEAGAKTAAELDVDFEALDVADPAGWSSCVAAVEERHGGIDLAYLNAGVSTYPEHSGEMFFEFHLDELPLDLYRRIMGANVDGVILGARALVPALARRGGGALIATASIAGVIAFAPDPVYTATKHAVVGFIRAMAPNLARDGIACHAILPGVVDTPMLAPGTADRAREMGLGVIEPGHIADAVVHAARDEGSGKLWVCLADRAPTAYEFAAVEGLLPA